MSIYTLYVKTHIVTGLRYLGFTTSQDPHKYSGSGTRWLNHLNKHGYNYTTEIIKQCQSKEELKEWGLYYSTLWNVVDSNEWANLKEEAGDGGRQSEESRKKMSESKKGSIPWNKGKKGVQIPWNKGLKGEQVAWNKGLKQPITEERREKLKGLEPWNKGKKGSQTAWNKGKEMPKIECPHCGKLTDKLNAKKWHFDNCKLKN